MGNLFIVAFSLIFSFALFHQNIVFSGVNRAYLGLYKGVPEAGVVAYGANGEYLEHPYFDVEMTVRAVDGYFDKALKSYVATYKTTYWFYDDDWGETIEEPVVFIVRLQCRISDFQDFRRDASFMIKEN